MKVNQIGYVMVTADKVVIRDFDVTFEPSDGPLLANDWARLLHAIIIEWAAARLIESFSDFPAVLAHIKKAIQTGTKDKR